MKIAEGYFTSNEKPSASKKRWIEKIGSYRYFALLLADFNPVTANLIYNQRASVIAQAYVSRACYNYSE